MWGERGLVATFFRDVSASATFDRWQQFLVKIGCSLGDQKVTEAWCVVEPDFANTGFGHPDAVFRLTFDNEFKAVFLLEAKLTTFEKASWSESRRYEDNFNSTINGQIELNHRLTLALQSFQPEVAASLAEPDWVPTLYSPGTVGMPRQVKKRAVLEQVARPLAHLEANCYFHVTITTDHEAPWKHLPHDRRPKMFVQGGKDSWDDRQGRLCWTNWVLLREIAHQWERNSFCRTYDFFHPSFVGYVPAHQNRPTKWSFGKVGSYTVLVVGPGTNSSRVVPVELVGEYFPRSFTTSNDKVEPLIPQSQVDRSRLVPRKNLIYRWAPPPNEKNCPRRESSQPTPPVQVRMLDPSGETSRVILVNDNQGDIGDSFLVYTHHIRRHSVPLVTPTIT